MVSWLPAYGIYSYKSYYSDQENGYYNFDILMLMVSFMYQCRKKMPEKLQEILEKDITQRLNKLTSRQQTLMDMDDQMPR